jgi:hypothetical protein
MSKQCNRSSTKQRESGSCCGTMYRCGFKRPLLRSALERKGVDFGVRTDFTLLCGKQHLGVPGESLRNPRRNATWLLGSQPELAPYFDSVIDLGHGCCAQQWQKLRRVALGADVPLTNDLIFVEGFSNAEGKFRWTVGRRSLVFLPLVCGQRATVLQFILRPLVDGRSKTMQRATVRAGKKTLAHWK